MDPATIALLTSLIQLGGTAAGSYFSRDQGTPGSAYDTMDLVLQAARGEGPLASLVNMDDDAFQRSVVNPMTSVFQNQVAPGIQQEFIGNRLQGGTGLNDALSRAGVDMQSNIDALYMDYQNQGLQNLLSLFNNAKQPDQGTAGQSGMDAIGAGLGGALSKFDFGDLMNAFSKGGSSSTPSAPSTPGGIRRTGMRRDFVN